MVRNINVFVIYKAYINVFVVLWSIGNVMWGKRRGLSNQRRIWKKIIKHYLLVALFERKGERKRDMQTCVCMHFLGTRSCPHSMDLLKQVRIIIQLKLKINYKFSWFSNITKILKLIFVFIYIIIDTDKRWFFCYYLIKIISF